MRKGLLLIVILFAIFICQAQDKKKIKLKANWKKGDIKEVVALQSGSWVMNGEETIFPIDTSAQYRIEIVDKNSKGYIVEWKIINKDKELDDVDFMKEYISDFKYVIKTDLNGNFKELANSESLVELNSGLKEKVISEVKKEGVSQAEFDKFIEKLKLAETKDEIIEMCHGLTDVFHGIFGEELLVNDTIVEPTTIPNPHLEEGIPATLKTIAKVLDNDLVSIRYAYVYDYEKLRSLHEEHFPEQEYTEQKTTSYSDYIYNQDTGWIEKVTFYNEYEDENNKSITVIEYRIK